MVSTSTTVEHYHNHNKYYLHCKSNVSVFNWWIRNVMYAVSFVFQSYTIECNVFLILYPIHQTHMILVNVYSGNFCEICQNLVSKDMNGENFGMHRIEMYNKVNIIQYCVFFKAAFNGWFLNVSKDWKIKLFFFLLLDHE